MCLSASHKELPTQLHFIQTAERNREVSGALSCVGLCMPGPGYSKAGLSPLREGRSGPGGMGCAGVTVVPPVARVPFASYKLPGSSDWCPRGSEFLLPSRASLIPITSDLITPTPTPSLQDEVHAPQRGMKKPSLQPYRPAVHDRARLHAPNRQRCGLLSPERPPAHACSPLPTGATPSLQGPTTTMLFHATDT